MQLIGQPTSGEGKKRQRRRIGERRRRPTAARSRSTMTARSSPSISTVSMNSRLSRKADRLVSQIQRTDQKIVSG